MYFKVDISRANYLSLKAHVKAMSALGVQTSKNIVWLKEHRKGPEDYRAAHEYYHKHFIGRNTRHYLLAWAFIKGKKRSDVERIVSEEKVHTLDFNKLLRIITDHVRYLDLEKSNLPQFAELNIGLINKEMLRSWLKS